MVLNGEFESESGIRDEFARIGVTSDAPSDEVIRLKPLLDESARETLKGVLVEYDMDLENGSIVRGSGIRRNA